MWDHAPLITRDPASDMLHPGYCAEKVSVIHSYSMPNLRTQVFNVWEAGMLIRFGIGIGILGLLA